MAYFIVRVEGTLLSIYKAEQLTDKIEDGVKPTETVSINASPMQLQKVLMEAAGITPPTDPRPMQRRMR